MSRDLLGQYPELRHSESAAQFDGDESGVGIDVKRAVHTGRNVRRCARVKRALCGKRWQSAFPADVLANLERIARQDPIAVWFVVLANSARMAAGTWPAELAEKVWELNPEPAVTMCV